MKLWDLLPIIKDTQPMFVIFKGDTLIDVLTFEQLATNNILNQLYVRKMRTQYGDGRTTYLFDCEGLNDEKEKKRTTKSKRLLTKQGHVNVTA